MDTFFTGFIFGIIVSIAAGIFIWTIRGGKGVSSRTLEKRIDTNNSDTGRGIEKLRDNNTEAGKITTRGLESIDNTKRSVSEIIAASKRKRRLTDKE